ncbi:Protein Aster-B [Mactra antiquata]
MEATLEESTPIKLPKRKSSIRHKRTSSDLPGSREVASNSNGLKAVHTVTGAIQNLLKLASSPLVKGSKAKSFDSIDRASSHDSLTLLHRKDSLKMEKRRSSAALSSAGRGSSPLTNTSKEGSPDSSSNRKDSRDGSTTDKPDSSLAVAFSIDGDSFSEMNGATGSPARTGTPSRKSTDSSDSARGYELAMDIGERSFESSLNNILNKCSETSYDVTSDGKDDSKKSDRKKKSTPWYSMLSPTYKSRSEDFKRQFKEIPTDERLIVDYSCALQKEILVHGRMFVTQNWICFYANIFRWETVVTIPTKDILAITKEKTARVIPNAVQVTTDKEKYFFTSFTARDKTFMMLFRLWQNALMDQPMPPQELWHWVHSSYGEELGLTSSDDDYVPPPNMSETKDGQTKDGTLVNKGDSSDLALSGGLANDNYEDGDCLPADISLNDSSLLELGHTGGGNNDKDPTDCSDTTEGDQDVSEGEIVCSEHDHFPKLAHNEVYQMPLEKLFELLFTDSDFFKNFTEKARKYTDVTVTPWQDDPDEAVGRARVVRYTIPLNAPFGPKTSNTVEKHLCYKSSQPGVMYLIDAECTPLGIPYSDAFYVVNRYCLTRVSKEKCRLRVTSEVKFRKSLWGVVKNMIERNSVQGVLDYFQSLGIHLRRESEKQQSVQGMPTKRKLRKRRSHALRGVNVNADHVSTSRQISRSHQAEKLITPPTPTRNISTQKEEKLLLRMNADTLIRIVCFILILLVMFNALLFYKLWSLETMANVLYLPDSEDSIHSFTKHPPKTHEEWMHLLHQQRLLHSSEIKKWKDLLGTSIQIVDHMKQTLVHLKEHIDDRNIRLPTEHYCDTDTESCSHPIPDK